VGIRIGSGADILGRKLELVEESSPSPLVDEPNLKLTSEQGETSKASNLYSDLIAASTSANRKDINPNGIVVKFARLQIKPPPENVDGKVLEAYLSEQEFVALFKITPTNFYKLPKWQQLVKKKETGVF